MSKSLAVRVVGWMDAGNGLQRAAAAEAQNVELWRIAEMLKQTEVRQPPDRLRDTRGIPVWSLRCIPGDTKRWWCVAVQYRGPGHAAGVLQFAFVPVDGPAVELWAAVALLAGREFDLIPWGETPVDVTEALEYLENLATQTPRRELRRGIHDTLLGLAQERSRIGIEGNTSTVAAVVGKVLGLLPARVTESEFTWATCTLHLPESRHALIVSGYWPTEFAEKIPATAARLRTALSDGALDGYQALDHEHLAMLNQLADTAAAGTRYADGDEIEAFNIRDLLKIHLTNRPRKRQLTMRERLEDLDEGVEIKPGPLRKWAAEEPGEAAGWLFYDRQGESARRGDAHESAILGVLVHALPATAAWFPSIVGPITEGTPTARLASLMLTHLSRDDQEALLPKLASPGLGRRGRQAAEAEIRAYLGLPDLQSRTPNRALDKLVEQIKTRQTQPRRRTKTQRARPKLTDLAVIELKRHPDPSEAAFEVSERLQAESDFAPAAGAMLLEVLADHYKKNPDLWRTVQEVCVREWLDMQTTMSAEQWLTELIDDLRAGAPEPIDRELVLRTGLAHIKQSPLRPDPGTMQFLERLLPGRSEPVYQPESSSEPRSARSVTGPAPASIEPEPHNSARREGTTYQSGRPVDGDTGSGDSLLHRGRAWVREASISAKAFGVVAVGLVVATATGVVVTSTRDDEPSRAVQSEQPTSNQAPSEAGAVTAGSGQENWTTGNVGAIQYSFYAARAQQGQLAITGWAVDTTDTSRPVRIAVNADWSVTKTGRVWDSSALANQQNPPVKVSGNHGFSLGTPIREPGTVRLTLYAVVKENGRQVSKPFPEAPIVAVLTANNFPGMTVRPDEAGKPGIEQVENNGHVTLRGYSDKKIEGNFKVRVYLDQPAGSGRQPFTGGLGTASQQTFTVDMGALRSGTYGAWVYLYNVEGRTETLWGLYSFTVK